MSDMEQFAELELTKEDHDQIFDPPTDRQHPLHQESYRAASGLNGIEFEGSKLHAENVDKQQQQRRNPRNRNQFYGMSGPGRQTDFPLRLLVQSEMVGAIIGRQGSTIRQITQQSRARVDVHRKENIGALEKAITIYGNPDNCTNACKRILEVMQQEANNTNMNEISLKILAHNNLIGRIIGKSGNTIKRIMMDTDTKITVSSINDINSFNYERIITVKGSIDNMSRAENQISSKLRQSYENDLQAMAPQSIMFPGLNPVAMMSTSSNNMGFPPRGGGNESGGMMPGPSFVMCMPPSCSGMPPGSETQETTFLYIPNAAVGAIIGTKGSHIRNIIRFSGATVKIAPLESDKPLDQQSERKVTIVGNPEAQWKAQYLIFEKIREEGFASGTGDVRLTVEILVASSQVGRIIGKGGQTVRELQRVTGTTIKLPEHGATASPDDETTVHIIGPFYSVQSAQRRIRAMMMSTNPPPASKKVNRRDTSTSSPGQQQTPSTTSQAQSAPTQQQTGQPPSTPQETVSNSQ